MRPYGPPHEPGRTPPEGSRRPRPGVRRRTRFGRLPRAVRRLWGGARGALPAALVLALLLPVVVATAGPARAAGYRYWSYWYKDRGAAADDRWVYATRGPSQTRPGDGSVQGFRFAVSDDSKDAQQPRGSHDFATVCADTPARPDTKRVALVLDFGTAADAPRGERPPKPRTACVRTDTAASTADLLAEVAKPLRYDTNLLLCGIAGYPRTGCGEQVSDTGADGEDGGTSAGDGGASSGHGIPSAGVLVGVAAVAVIGGAALWRSRRRRS